MKTKILLAIVLLLSVSNAYSQLEVNSDGSITVSCFKVNGYMAGFTGNSGTSNVSFGYNALSNPSTTQNFNVAVGTGALASNISGFGNTATGGEALHFNTGGYFNAAHGYKALYANISGYCNTACGTWSLRLEKTATLTPQKRIKVTPKSSVKKRVQSCCSEGVKKAESISD